MIRRSDRADVVTNSGSDRSENLFSNFNIRFEGDISVDGFTLDVVRKTDDGRFDDVRIVVDGIFNFAGSDAVTRNVDDIVDAACDPEITVFVASSTVSSEVEARASCEVGVFVAFVVSEDCACQTGQGALKQRRPS